MWCNGDPSIELFRGDELLGAMNWQHDVGFGWPGRLTLKSRERLTRWLAEHGYNYLSYRTKRQLAIEKQELARRKREAKQYAAIVNYYPQRARQFFPRPDHKEDEEAPERLDVPANVAKAVGDPVKLAVITCRAMGAIDAGFRVDNSAGRRYRRVRNGQFQNRRYG